MRKEFEPRLHDLAKERLKISKRKKANREKKNLLKNNTKERLYIICKVLRKTYKYYEDLYMESDNMRVFKLQEAKYQAEIDKEREREKREANDSKSQKQQYFSMVKKEQELQKLYDSVINKNAEGESAESIFMG